MLKKIYRICDNRDGKTLIQGVTKRKCFLNFIKVFGNSNLTIVADNTRQETLDFLNSYTDNIHVTSLGNSKSFMYALDLALMNDEHMNVYLVEDDYLHVEDAEKFIQEGLQNADYVSLYDHLDKYIEPSPNPFVKNGGEDTKVILTPSTHWKYTNSSTMTFAARVNTLKEDYKVMRQHCITDIPQDFFMFTSLLKKGRRIVTPIPGRSTHCDHFPSPFIFSAPLPI